MSKDPEITRIDEVRGSDGSTAYEVHGGAEGQGGSSYYLTREAMHNLERQGKAERQETLKRLMQSTLDGRGEVPGGRE